MNSITDDVFNYLLESFLSREEKTILRLLNKKYKNKYTNYINIKTLVKNNNIDTIKELIIEYPITNHVFCGLVEYGNTELLDWFILHNNITYMEYLDPYKIAAKRNNIDILKWLEKNINMMSKTYGYDISLYNGSLDVIKWCYERHDKYISICKIMHGRNGFYYWNLEIIKWIHNTYISLNPILYKYIVYDVNMINWLIESGLLNNTNILHNVGESICRHGNVELLKLLNLLNLSEGLLGYYFNVAAKEGNVDIMKYLYKCGMSWDYNMFTNVISSCNKIGSDKCIEIIKWLLNPLSIQSTKNQDEQIIIDEENACSWGYVIYSKCNGNMKIVKWLMEVGCPVRSIYGVDDAKIFYTNMRDVIDNYDLLVKTGFILDNEDNEDDIEQTDKLVEIVCKNGDISTLKWLESEGFKIPARYQILRNACKSGNLELVKFIYNKDIEVYCYNYAYASMAAVEYGHTHILEWMKETGLNISVDKRWNNGRYVSKKGYDWLIANNYIYNYFMI
ncbi:Ankyrin-repeat protein [Orpheovirus IHUMI-LCC2]|uniref:Ankyrin-repeat protein n=1 Tax=Orpheovirus IHUMI-LCC2 TaxID=2023057 RepID=A0A2I2L4A5_9VIRU|nr:Ankyrin-repeat protein [Orpheovirus IHUMI-LCC2]SNW62357.1 Ankyrin-repeat protein [Orpheovirus IHUMI-LCC2]